MKRALGAIRTLEHRSRSTSNGLEQVCSGLNSVLANSSKPKVRLRVQGRVIDRFIGMPHPLASFHTEEY